mgnify:CR=1 FL=1
MPWFSQQLVCGNSLIGARRQIYRVNQLPTSTARSAKPRKLWHEYAPQELAWNAELPDDGARLDRLCELNVARQVINVANTTVVQEAWRREQPLSIHGWIYSIANGKLSDLDLGVNNNPELRTLEADSYNG